MIYRFINANTLRIAISLLYGFIIIKINKMVKKKYQLSDDDINKIDNKYKVISKIISILIVIGIWNIPYEDIFFRFKTPEEVLNYYYPTNKVLKKYDYKDYAYIWYEDSGYCFSHFVKKNGRWVSDDKSFKSNDKMLFFDYSCSGQLSKIKEKNVTGIQVDCYSDKSVLVKDSYSSKFDEFIIRDKDVGDTYTYFTIIKGNIDKNYTITIDDKEYKVLNCIYK